MESLIFKELPLRQVMVKMAISAPMHLVQTTIMRIAELFQDSFPESHNSGIYEPSPQAMVVVPNAIDSLGYMPSDRKSALIIQSDLLMSVWDFSMAQKQDYIGFEALAANLEYAWGKIQTQISPDVVPILVQMKYVNFVATPIDTPPYFLNPSFMQSFLVHGRFLRKMEFVFGSKELIDVAIKSYPGAHPEDGLGFSLETVAGKEVHGQDWRDVLGECHAQLQKVFVETISDEAKAKWQLS